MGWNTGYAIMEEVVVTLYNENALTPIVLDCVMNPFKNTDCDSGGSRNLTANDGLGVEEIICKIISPVEYQDAIENPEYYEGEEPCWASNARAHDLFYSIWHGIWGIW